MKLVVDFSTYMLYYTYILKKISNQCKSFNIMWGGITNADENNQFNCSAFCFNYCS